MSTEETNMSKHKLMQRMAGVAGVIFKVKRIILLLIWRSAKVKIIKAFRFCLF